MYYFIIPFTAAINGDLMEKGFAGVVSRVNDYRSNAVKTTAIEFFQKKYNTSKPVIVSITGRALTYTEDLYRLLRCDITIEVVEKGMGRLY